MQGPLAPYEPPRDTGSPRPAVILLFRLYALAAVVANITVVALWVSLEPPHPSSTPSGSSPPVEALLVVAGVVLFGMGALFGVGACVPYKPWGWTLGLVLICLGMTSCAAIVAVPLLIYWLQPRTKAAFCRL